MYLTKTNVPINNKKLKNRKFSLASASTISAGNGGVVKP